MGFEYEEDSRFYLEALSLLREAGLTDTFEPVYCNYSLDQVVHYDCSRSYALTMSQRITLNELQNISCLFELNDLSFDKRSKKTIRFYSAELTCIDSMRSQIAYEAHTILNKIINCEASVVVLRHKTNIMISLAGFRQRSVLSDWFSIDCYDDLIDKLNILNVRLDTAKHFFFDLVFSVAREYYTHPISKEQAMFTTIPDNYRMVVRDLDERYSREELVEIINDALNYYINKYGDDYVAESKFTVKRGKAEDSKSYEFDIDMMLLSMNDEDDDSSFGEVIDNTEAEYEEATVDDYDYNDLDPEIFKDPEKMVKWLEQQSGQS